MELGILPKCVSRLRQQNPSLRAWKRNEAVPTAQDCTRTFDLKLRDRLEVHKKDSRDGLTERDLLNVWLHPSSFPRVQQSTIQKILRSSGREERLQVELRSLFDKDAIPSLSAAWSKNSLIAVTSMSGTTTKRSFRYLCRRTRRCSRNQCPLGSKMPKQVNFGGNLGKATEVSRLRFS